MATTTTSIQGGITMYYIYDFYRGEFLESTFEKKRDAKVHIKKIVAYRNRWNQSHKLVIFKKVSDEEEDSL